jgi:hypothetical protein
MWRSGL